MTSAHCQCITGGNPFNFFSIYFFFSQAFGTTSFSCDVLRGYNSPLVQVEFIISAILLYHA